MGQFVAESNIRAVHILQMRPRVKSTGVSILQKNVKKKTQTILAEALIKL